MCTRRIRSELPTTKKIRVEQELSIQTTQESAPLYDVTRLFSDVFVWIDIKIIYLCIGLVRQHIKMGINDISSIIIKYFAGYPIYDHNYLQLRYVSQLSDKCVTICNFKGKNNYGSKHGDTTIIFAPYISQLYTFNANKMINYEMTFKLLNNECVKNNRFYVQCGLICIPQNAKISLSELQQIFVNANNHKRPELSNLPYSHHRFNLFTAHFMEIIYIPPLEACRIVRVVEAQNAEFQGKTHDLKFWEQICNVPIHTTFGVSVQQCRDQWFLYFNQKLAATRQTTINLNINNYDYLWAFSTQTCECTEDATTGIEFVVSFDSV